MILLLALLFSVTQQAIETWANIFRQNVCE
jgi:hypothetical protein